VTAGAADGARRPPRTPLAVYARPPRAGEAKTRLTPALDAHAQARLAAAFVADVVDRALALAEVDVTLWVAGDVDDSAFDAAALPPGLARRAQRGADLGERMAHTLDTMIELAGRGIVIGADAPTAPTSLLRAAVQALAHHDVVLAPVADGGFWLVGSRVPLGRAFAGVRWSSPHTLADTMRGVREAGASLVLLPPWYDVDTPDDLRLLRAHLALRPTSAPRTARALGF